MDFSKNQLERYKRNIAIKEIGLSGQKKLSEAKVLVVGCGGLGSPAALYLSASGIGTLGLIDNDVVELSNLQRQIIHSTDTLGIPKAISAKRTLERLNPDTKVIAMNLKVTRENLPKICEDYDFILDCTDSFASKYIVSDSCVKANKPYVHAAVVRFLGQVMTVIPGKTPCYRCIFRDEPLDQSLPSPEQLGVMGASCGIIGALEALEAIKYITGVGELLTGYLLSFDGLNMTFNKVKLPLKDDDCPCCGHLN